MNGLAKLGAIAFALWSLLHIVGAGMILTATLGGGAGAGYGIYGYDGSAPPPVTGWVLSYLAFLIGMAGAVALAVAVRLNWRNSEAGLAVNTGLCFAVELGLILFLVTPGHVSVAEAAYGLALLVLGAGLGGLACRMDPAHAR